LFLSPQEVHFFDDIGYQHDGFYTCPDIIDRFKTPMGQCDCHDLRYLRDVITEKEWVDISERTRGSSYLTYVREHWKKVKSGEERVKKMQAMKASWKHGGAVRTGI
jgi:hypothetical protein